MSNSAIRLTSDCLRGNADHSAPMLVHHEGPAGGYWQGTFEAMASSCELLLASNDQDEAAMLTQAVADEAWRIERKFSRYRADNIVHAINTSRGRPVKVDGETGKLLAFANTCYFVSEGRFDITSGVLRRVWRFDGSGKVPERKAVKAVRKLIGWNKVGWQPPVLTLGTGMEIDFGGIGKEYAVDRCALLISGRTSKGALVNFGGDLVATGPRADGSPWQIGIEKVRDDDASAPVLSIARGAVATSGDARRFVVRNGVRYGHILDPTTGWSVEHAPRSVTVLDGTCLQAGLLATLAMLHGAGAEEFLAAQNVRFYVLR